MKTNKLFSRTLLASAITVAATSQTIFANDIPSHIASQIPTESNRYIVKFNNSFDLATASFTGQMEMTTQAYNLLNAHGADIKVQLLEQSSAAIEISQRDLQNLLNSGAIESYEVDPIRWIPEAMEESANISPMAESTPYGINMVQALQVSDALVGNRKVCIMDTGYERDHEDLRSTGVTGDDNNGSGSDTGNWWEDGNGHGTHVAGTIAALGGNNTGVVGVNRSGELDLHIVKVFNNSGNWGYGSDLVAAINQCRSAGSDVISMSLGGGGSSNSERNAFEAAASDGILSIAAAGNSGNSSFSYPASYDIVMSVAAVNSSKNRASFSQYNSQVEIAAPGVGVNSTWINNSYNSISGTSMATPHVAGVAALVWSHYTQCTPAQIRGALNASAEDRGSAGRDTQYGWGIVQAKAAYDYLAAGCDGDGSGGGGGGDTQLEKGVPQTGLSGSQGELTRFTFDVPANASNLSFDMSGGSGDADLYVRFGAEPTTSTYDCRPYRNGNNESCDFSTAQAGTYYVMIRGYSAYSGVSLVADYTDGSGGGGGGDSVTVENLAADRYDWVYYTMDVPAGATKFSASISGGSGDADLYIRYGSQPTTSSYSCRPYLNGNNESCTQNNPAAGTWHIGVRAYSTFSGVTLNYSYE